MKAKHLKAAAPWLVIRGESELIAAFAYRSDAWRYIRAMMLLHRRDRAPQCGDYDWRAEHAKHGTADYFGGESGTLPDPSIFLE